MIHSPENKPQDLLAVMHRVYREMLLEAAGRPGATWKDSITIDMFASEKGHGSMGAAAGFLNRVITKCGNTRNPWMVVAHTHECEHLRLQPGEVKHAHVCGFYAVWIAENESVKSRKLTFPFTSATEGEWIQYLSLDIYELFVEADMPFVWSKP